MNPALLILLPVLPALSGAEWYDGVDSIRVFNPNDDVGSYAYQVFQSMKYNQFGTERHALILTRGDYGNLQMPVGYYTSIIGVGDVPSDVTVASFYSNDGLYGEATCNFWRSAEGVTTTNPSIRWATSQACPLRRIDVQGDLELSGSGWSSGGFLSDVTVGGKLKTGTQQQFFFRNAHLTQGVDWMGGWNFVFVGVEGAPQPWPVSTSKKSGVTTIGTTPIIAEKPFLVENNGAWSIVVPSITTDTQGPQGYGQSERIPIEEFYVAKDGDTGADINSGIVGKKGLLLTPAVYLLDQTVRITQDGFIVLGIGFPTLVTREYAAVAVEGSNVRVAGILLEAAASRNVVTQPLLLWSGYGGVLSDIFTRTGALSYSRGFHASCTEVRADTHVQIDGQGVILDNTWFWHADHDDCGGLSDKSYSGNGLVVNGADVTAYGLKSEHQMKDLVLWNGENGRVFFFQSELPYHDLAFGSQGYTGYTVSYSVRSHTAYGLGVYIVGDLTMPTAFRFPPTANVHNMLAWDITGDESHFRSVACTAPDRCLKGDSCYSGRACYLASLPPAPPTPPPSPPTPPSPFHCNPGDNVRCPNSRANCMGRECCPDGSICPSAPADFTGCPKPKTEDCTKASAAGLTNKSSIIVI